MFSTVDFGSQVTQILNVKRVHAAGNSGEMEMKQHGIPLESCPRCGKQGLLFERDTMTKRGDKKYTY